MGKKITIKLDLEVAKLIASYYQFPTAVFLLDIKDAKKMLKGTRKAKFGRAWEKLEQIKEIIESD